MEMEKKMQNRLMTIKECQIYAGGIGRNLALKLSKEANVRVRIGRLIMIDRIAFDTWIEKNRDAR